MKTFSKIAAIVLVLAMVLAMTACGGGTTSSTPASSAPASEPESTPAEEPADDVDEPAEEPLSDGALDTPRNETLYIGGRQWGKPINMNPLSPKPNFTAVDQSDMATVFVYETLYMFNLIDGVAYPLLADGDYVWNDDRTVLTVKIKEAAKWSDGTALTANDVEATWDAHFKYETHIGVDYAIYIESVVAIDDYTVEFTAVTGDDYNPLKVLEVLPKVYVQQKAWLEALDAELGGDANEMKNATMFDAPHSGPYSPVLYDSEQKWVTQRDDNYWGQDASMWGKLPVPKYLAHNIYTGNDTSAVGFKNGEIDVNQQYMANIQDLWEKDGLPISTYLDEPPYQLAASLPTIWFNCTLPGLDQAAVRKAIAYAVNYDQVVTSAMTGQSPTFTAVPRSLFNPTDGEQSLIRDPEALAPYQFAGSDIAGANKLLDDAGIVDTDGDGIREYEGTKLSFKAECPTGWTDWEASIQIVAAAGSEIGIEIEAYHPEAAQWTENIQTGNFEIAMNSAPGASIANPWTRAYQTMYGYGGNFPERTTFAISRWYNERAEELLDLIPKETDEDKVKEYYEELNVLYLDEVPSFAVMYRPAFFHAVYEGVWTGFASAGDGTNIPPQVATSGYGIADLYNLQLVG